MLRVTASTLLPEGNINKHTKNDRAEGQQKPKALMIKLNPCHNLDYVPPDFYEIIEYLLGLIHCYYHCLGHSIII